LLRVIRQDADAARPGIDEEIDAAALAVEIERAALVEDRRGDGEYPGVACACGHLRRFSSNGYDVRMLSQIMRDDGGCVNAASRGRAGKEMALGRLSRNRYKPPLPAVPPVNSIGGGEPALHVG